MVEIIGLTFTAIGCAIMTIATIRYVKLLKHYKDEIYSSNMASNRQIYFALVSMLFFILGFLVGMFDIAMRKVEPIYYFIIFTFFLGAVFAFAMVDGQIKMAVKLRAKTMEVMKTFVNAIDMKDAYTRGHSQQVYATARLLYHALDESMQEGINELKLLDAALLHDIGKISIPDDVLKKEGKLTMEDWALIKTHPLKGKMMLDDTSFREISDWVLYHHERMDGKGYYHIAAADIPIESRIIALVDSYCALCTDRVYRKKCSHDEAIAIMKQVSGTQLDPQLMERFLEIDPTQLANALGEGTPYNEDLYEYEEDCQSSA